MKYRPSPKEAKHIYDRLGDKWNQSINRLEKTYKDVNINRLFERQGKIYEISYPYLDLIFKLYQEKGLDTLNKEIDNFLNNKIKTVPKDNLEKPLKFDDFIFSLTFKGIPTKEYYKQLVNTYIQLLMEMEEKNF